mmetsp:Transcript_62055/g.103055  ORF Transcript_62055/g.103055 Transcript_62055/m.103055 type:complete len:99 (-) Transcript_62055:133-429(-)
MVASWSQGHQLRVRGRRRGEPSPPWVQHQLTTCNSNNMAFALTPKSHMEGPKAHFEYAEQAVELEYTYGSGHNRDPVDLWAPTIAFSMLGRDLNAKCK